MKNLTLYMLMGMSISFSLPSYADIYVGLGIGSQDKNPGMSSTEISGQTIDVHIDGVSQTASHIKVGGDITEWFSLEASNPSFGNNGMFIVDELRIIASDGGGWEHVSVSREDRIPTWGEMSLIKDLFWDDEDFVVQMHPPKSDYVNNHPRCLHLWRKSGTNDFCERPPSIFVGPKASNDD